MHPMRNVKPGSPRHACVSMVPVACRLMGSAISPVAKKHDMNSAQWSPLREGMGVCIVRVRVTATVAA